MMPHKLSTTARAKRLGGFTLLELMAVVAAAAAVLSLILPALSRSRRSAEQTVSLSNMRQHASVFALYHADFRDDYPYFTSPTGIARVRCGAFWVDLNYFEAYTSWNMALADWYYEGCFDHDSFAPPGFRDTVLGGAGRLLFTPYWWSNVFLADPSYWTYESRRGSHQWRATRAPEVSYPSRKGLLVQDWPYWSGVVSPASSGGEPAVPIAFVDGSARTVQVSDVLPGHWEGTGVPVGASLLCDYPAMNTINGVRGRDVQ